MEGGCVKDQPQQGCQAEGLQIGHDVCTASIAAAGFQHSRAPTKAIPPQLIQWARASMRFMETPPPFIGHFQRLKIFVSHPRFFPLQTFEFQLEGAGHKLRFWHLCCLVLRVQ